MPLGVLNKVGTDLLTIRNEDCQIVTDCKTKFFETSKPPNTQASTVVLLTKTDYKVRRSKYGFRDNEPQFSF